MGALPALMLLMSALMKFVKPPPVVEGFAHLGLPDSLALGLGILELICTVIYLVPAHFRPRRDSADWLPRGRNGYTPASG